MNHTTKSPRGDSSDQGFNGIGLSQDDQIATEAIWFFAKLFSDDSSMSTELLYLIPQLVTEDDNKALEAIPTLDEVQQVVFEMDGESSFGLDGFMGKFVTFAWDVLAHDVYNAVVNFFCGAELPWFMASTAIVLIPKVPNPQDFSKFQPINLCNFFNKILLEF